MRKINTMRSQETSFDRSKRKFERIKQYADAVDTTGMTKDEADKERMYAALGMRLKKPKRLH